MRTALVPRSIVLVASILVLAPSLSARAQTAERQFGFAATYGSAGLGGSISYGVSKQFHLRLDGQGLGAQLARDGDQVEWTAAGLVDWFPTALPIRVTGGLGWVSQRVESALDGSSYRESHGAPYLGLGWGNVLDSKGRFSLLVDAGTYYQFGAYATRSAPSGSLGALKATDGAKPARTEVEFRQRFVPVVSAGVGFRF